MKISVLSEMGIWTTRMLQLSYNTSVLDTSALDSGTLWHMTLVTAVLFGGVFLWVVFLHVEVEKRTRALTKSLKSHEEMQIKVEQANVELHEKNAEIASRNQELEETLETVKSMQENIIKSEKMAALGGMIAGITHEVSTPLGVSRTIVSHLKEVVHNDLSIFDEGSMKKSDLRNHFAKMIEGIDILENNVERGIELLDEFKKFSINQTKDELRDFDLCGFIMTVFKSLKYEIKKKDATYEVICNGAQYSKTCEAESIQIRSYPSVFAQILTNLIMNSLIHGIESEGHIKVEVTQHEHEIQLKYLDNGVGVSDEELAQIFELFFTTKGDSGGSGLGMPIINQLVKEQLQGEISCHSQKNEGFGAMIRFPMNLN